MGVYNHADYDWVGVVYPDGAHGSYDQAELDLFDADKRFTNLKSAVEQGMETIGSSLVDVIGKWTTYDTSSEIGYIAVASTALTAMTINVADSAKWDSVWNPEHYRIVVSGRAFYWRLTGNPIIIVDGLYIKSIATSGVFLLSTRSSSDTVTTLFKKVIIEGQGISNPNYEYGTYNLMGTVSFDNCIFIGLSTAIFQKDSGSGNINNCAFIDCTTQVNGTNHVMTNSVIYSEVAGQTNCVVSVNGMSDYNATNASSGLSGLNSLLNISDPFIDYATHDLRIPETSPLYEAGTEIADISEDIVGVSRPQSQYFDIGAFEYDSGGQTGVPVDIKLLNLAIGSRCIVQKTSDGTEVLAPFETSVMDFTGSFAYLEDTPVIVKVRKSSPGDPTRYKTYKAPGIITKDGLTVYVDQQVDEVLN